MPSISIWLNSEDYKHLEELSKLLNRKPSRVIKEILEDKISFKGIENHYSIVKELYKWYYYEGNGISSEKYIRRILKKKNIEAILSIISLHDDIRAIFKTLGTLMLIVSLKSYANIPEENFSLLKLLKYDLIEDIKHIKVHSVPLLYSKILWTRCIEKIRELSINKAKSWECLAFTAGLFAVMILGQETPDEIYAKYGLNDFEKEWKELFTQMIKIVSTEEKLVPKCAICKNILQGVKCICGSTEFYLEDALI